MPSSICSTIRGVAATAMAVMLCAYTVAPSTVSADTSEWETSATPTEEDGLLIPGSDIIDFTLAGCDGDTIYAIGLWYDECLESGDYQYWADGDNVMNSHLVPRFWKSSDEGVTWKDHTTDVQRADRLPAGEQFVFFSAVGAPMDDEDFVVVAGYDDDMETIVVGSNDGGQEFELMGCGDIPGEVLCVAVSPDDNGRRSIAVGTKDLTNGGKVWRLDTGGYAFSYWTDTSEFDGWLDPFAWDSAEDVFAITSLKFSPNFDYDETIVGMALGLGFSPDLAASAVEPDPLDYGLGYYPAYYYFAGAWNGTDAWNGEAGFRGYPGMFIRPGLLFFASTYLYGGVWTEYFESPFLRMATDIALPRDYTGEYPTDRTALVSINASVVPAEVGMPAAEGGYLFLMQDLAPTFELLNQNDNPFVASVAYYGSITLMGDAMVGLAWPADWNSADVRDWYLDGDPTLPCCEGVTVLYTDTPIGRNPCCPDGWKEARKQPSGQFNARVAFDCNEGLGYASTQGYSFRADSDLECYRSDESAFSRSQNRGECWNQTGLIDTDIDFIADAVLNGDCGQVLVATVNTADDFECCDCDSVWRSEDNGSHYIRVWNGLLEGAYCGLEWAALAVPPQEVEDIATIYMADLGTGTVYFASEGGLCEWDERNTGLDDIIDISTPESATVYALDSGGDIARSLNYARRWSERIDSGVDDDTGEHAVSIESHGDWVLVGGDRGDVSYSDDGGDVYKLLDDIGEGEVRLAFDSYFDDNGYIYAAVAEGGADNGLYRTTIEAAGFEDMNACDCETAFWDVEVSAPGGNPFTSSTTGGVLYATYTQDCTNDCPQSGVARCLNPAATFCCDALSWDYLFEGLPDEVVFNMEPDGLDICGCYSEGSDIILYAIDGRQYYDGWCDCFSALCDPDQGRLRKYTDCFAKAAPDLIGIADGSIIPSDVCECINKDFVLEWDRLCNACEYDIEISLNESFTHVVWTTSSICAGADWKGVNCVDHEDCNEGVLKGCESDMSFYKPADPCAPSLVVPRGELENNTKYWWRVRARVAETGEVYRSWWSDAWTFTVATGPGGAIHLTAPDDGATNVPLTSVVFTWTNVQGADTYEMTLRDSTGAEVATASGDFTSVVLSESLDYDSAYTWQVDAMSNGSAINSSNTSTFRTMIEPAPPPEIPETVIDFAEPPTTPAWVWVTIGLMGLLIVVVVVLIFRFLRV